MDNYLDYDIYAQLEHLKIKLNLKEREFASSIKIQKEDYEKMVKERDEEVTQFVDSLIKENYELKKVIVSLEIDIEKYKDKASYNEMTRDDDKDFFSNIKIIKESFEKKQKDLFEKYERNSKKFQKEHKHIISSIRKSAYENKMKIINNEEGQLDQDSFIPIRLMEEQLGVYDNKARMLYEDLKNKENYALVIEQKYEMLNEENKFLKLKIQEEKGSILKQIQEYQVENQASHEEFLMKLNFEINEKKKLLEKSIKDSTVKCQENISCLHREKESMKNEIESLNGKCEKMKKELLRSELEKEEILLRLDTNKKEIFNLENAKLKIEREIIEIVSERDTFRKTNNNLTDRLGELQSKVISLEITNKSLVEISSKEAEKIDVKYRGTIDNLNLRLEDSEKKLREIDIELSEKKSLLDQYSKKIRELEQQNDSQSYTIERLTLETNQKEVELKINTNDLGSLAINKEKQSKQIDEMMETINQKDVEIKSLNERVDDNDIQISTLKKDYQRLKQVKDDLLTNYEEVKKNNSVITAQLETTKITSTIEVQRFKNQILELEKKSQDRSKFETDLANSELKNHIRNMKLTIARLYKIYLNSSGNYREDTETILNQYEEGKMLSDMESGLEKLVTSFTIKLESTSEKTQKQTEKYEAEILNLKKRLNSFLQITNSVAGTSNPTSTNSFKFVEKENSNSLYENIIVYLRNINLKHLLELFQLNLQREEEINTVVIDKSFSTNLTATKSQIIDLYANFNSLKKICEQAFIEFQNRAKFYIQPEEFEKTVNECRNFTQNLIDMILDTLMNYKGEVSNFIVFKMPVDDYNLLIENISANLEKFSAKINTQTDSYNKIHGNIEKAIDILMKNTVVEYDLVNALMKEKFI